MFKNKLFKKKDIESIKNRVTKEVEVLIENYYNDLDNNALKYEAIETNYMEVKGRLEKELKDLKTNNAALLYKIKDENSRTRTELDRVLTFKKVFISYLFNNN